MSKDPSEITPVINAAGKLTALGGSAQSSAVAEAQALWARRHVDLAQLRGVAGRQISALTGAEASCVTSGAAAGIAISVAAIIAGDDIEMIHRLPDTNAECKVLLQAGHDVNFGAPIAQMIRLGGGRPTIFGSVNSVTERSLRSHLVNHAVTAMVFVQSHHCVQENMVSLERCIALCHEHDVPIIVDAAAEEDLKKYVEAGADLVTYSGGKAFGGPTTGFITGKKLLIDCCELQYQGIARTMKIGKEAIAGLLVALAEYVDTDPDERASQLRAFNDRILDGIKDCDHLACFLKPDEAGRPYSRVAVTARDHSFPIRELVDFLANGDPAIRTRNHHLDQGIMLIDPRELHEDQLDTIVSALARFDSTLADSGSH